MDKVVIPKRDCTKLFNVVCVYFSVPFFFSDQFKFFKKYGYDVHISCSPEERFLEWSNSHGATPHQVAIERKISPMSDLKAIRELMRIMRQEKFNIVCGHTPKGGLLSMIAAYLTGVKTRIYFRHGLVYETTYGMKRQLLIMCERIASFLSTKVVCVSPYLVERSLTDYLTCRDKMVVPNLGSCNGIDAYGQYNPANIDMEKKAILKNQLGLKGGEKIIGYTGRLVMDKGIVELVQAFERLDKEYDNVRLLLVGPFEVRDGVPENIVNIIKNNMHIIHTGLVEKDIEYYYALMNYLVLCTHREGFGTSILEASSMCKPVLTTAHTGSRDAIINDRTGVYVEMTPESLYDKLKIYIDNPELAEVHGKTGREHVLKNFEQEIIWNELLKIYRNKSC